jgi:hypothetical protein
MFHSRESFGFTAAILVVVCMMGVVLFRDTGTKAASPQALSDVAVTCAPTQRAVVHQTMTAGAPRVAVECADGAPGQASFVRDGFDERASYASGLVPAVYTPSMASAPLTARPAVQAPRRAASTGSTARAGDRRSWQKRALIIGGSTGAGAGIGGLIGGKKGALVGAAIGGGGAALVDALRD